MKNFVDGLLASVAPVWAMADEGGGGGAGGEENPGGGEWKAPEGLHADFVGTSADESLAKLMEGHTNLNSRFEGVREEMSKRPSAPKTADEYVFEASEGSAPWFGDVEKNPIMPLARDAALEFGMSNDQLNGFINKVFSAAGEAGSILPPLDPAAEIKTYMGLSKGDEASAMSDFTANETFAKGLRSQLKGLPEDEVLGGEIDGIMMSLTDTSAGNFLLSAMRSRLAESGMRIGGSGEGGEDEYFAKADLQKLASDARLDPKSSSFDKDFQTKYYASSKHHHSSKPTD